jgi:hypothetical protein
LLRNGALASNLLSLRCGQGPGPEALFEEGDEDPVQQESLVDELLVDDEPIDAQEMRIRGYMNQCANLTQELALVRFERNRARAAKELWHRRWCTALIVISGLVALDLAAIAGMIWRLSNAG